MKKFNLTLIEFKDITLKSRHALEFRYIYNLEEIQEEDSPRKKLTTRIEVDVGISDILLTSWNLDIDFHRGDQFTIEDDAVRVCYQYALENIKKQLNDGTIQREQQLWLLTNTTEDECPYEIEKIKIFKNKPISIEVADNTLKKEITKKDNHLVKENIITSDLPKEKVRDTEQEIELPSSFDIGSSIILKRDTINSLYHFKFTEILLKIDEEQSLLELFRPANNKEEFSYRITALGNLVANMNVKSLRKQTGNTNEEIKSIKLLEDFLNKNKDENDDTKIEEMLNVIRNLYNIRQTNPYFLGILYPKI